GRRTRQPPAVDGQRRRLRPAGDDRRAGLAGGDVRRWLAAAGLAGTGLLLARRYCTVVTVRGHSMNPTLLDGQRVLAIRRPRYRVGDVVVFRTPDLPGAPPAAGTRGDAAH